MSRIPFSDPDRRPSPRTLLALGVPVLLTGVGTFIVLDDNSPPESATGVEAAVDGDPTAVEQLAAATAADVAALVSDASSLDGTGNNLDVLELGSVGEIYPRETDANYADGIGEPQAGPGERYLSNRIFNDSNQNVFSENGLTHWSFVWGQFIDHTIGLRATADDDDEEDLVIAFDPDDPLEEFTNDLAAIATTRSAFADGTDAPRQQINTVSSYIDAWAVYGGTDERLDWLREGSLDGDPTNNEATLLTDDGYLPTADTRAGEDAPTMELMGRLFGDPSVAVIAGDARANENIGLTAVHTLFVREHNRIVDELPDDLDEQTKFEIARRVVTAMQQYITYTEFLSAMGVELDGYSGYDPTVDPSITNEFATVGYRAHSQIHGEFEAEIPVEQLTDEVMAALQRNGVSVEVDDDVAEVAVPLGVAFGNPGLLTDIGLGNLLAGLSSEAAYANDEQIDNQLRSVLFQIPGPDVENPLDCLDGSEIAGCYSVVNDLGALDVIRGYDHGMPTYNELRAAYGLDPVTSFAELTGEATDDFPDDPEIDAANPIDDPDILDFVYLTDADGNQIELDSDGAETSAVTAIRRSTTAARLKAVFGDVDSVDAFTGMVSEPHVEGTEFGELQLAMWTRQFQALRDGDRFFYGNDPALDAIAEVYGIDYRVELADLIVANTEIVRSDLPVSAFLLDDEAGDEPDGADDEVPIGTDDQPTGGELAGIAEGADDDDEGARPGRRADRRRDGERGRGRPRPPRRNG
jgi:hypothetical protein